MSDQYKAMQIISDHNLAQLDELDRYKRALEVARDFIQSHAKEIEYGRERYVEKLREIKQILKKE